jgi:hypothetical protein
MRWIPTWRSRGPMETERSTSGWRKRQGQFLAPLAREIAAIGRRPLHLRFRPAGSLPRTCTAGASLGEGHGGISPRRGSDRSAQGRAERR